MDIAGFFAAVGRHLKKALVIGVLFLALSVALALLLPSVYRSSSTILIEVQQIPEHIIASTVGGYIDAQLEAVEKRVQTNDNLWPLIEEFDLYKEARETQDKDTVVGMMRGDIAREISSFDTVNPFRVAGSNAGTFAFSLSYDSEDKEIVQKVNERITQLYVDENKKSRTEQASDVARFVRLEKETLETRLNELETRYSEFRKKNINYLPEQEENTRRQMDRAEDMLAISIENIKNLSARKRDLQTQQSLANTGVLSVQGKLSEAKQQLAQARTRYSDQHPDIIRLNSEIRMLQEQIASGDTQFVERPKDETAAGIARQAKLEDVIQELKAEQVKREKLETKLSDLGERLALAPQVGLEYQRLTREIEDVRGNYTEIKRNLMKVELSEKLEEEDKGERFVVMKAASPADEVKPNRPVIIVLGFVLSCGFAVLYILIADFFDRRIHGVKGLAAVAGGPPLATIPVITSAIANLKRLG